jgi:NAD(P)H-dependent flavin oxidoreductase YrpB (nitropropane dioxygenase family)
VDQEWKQMILQAASEDAVKFYAWNEFMPRKSGGYETSLRAISTPFIDRWLKDKKGVRQDAERLRADVLEAMRQGNLYELVPGAGQSAGLVVEILPAEEIVHQIAGEAERILERTTELVS